MSSASAVKRPLTLTWRLHEACRGGVCEFQRADPLESSGSTHRLADGILKVNFNCCEQTLACEAGTPRNLTVKLHAIGAELL